MFYLWYLDIAKCCDEGGVNSLKYHFNTFYMAQGILKMSIRKLAYLYERWYSL
jgi:hypothetical protein